MVEGAALLATSIMRRRRWAPWRSDRGANLLDSGAHFYEVYETKDRGHMAVGAIEAAVHDLLLRGLQIDPTTVPPQMERAGWPSMKQRFAGIFRSRTREEWTRVFADSDACVTPVLSPKKPPAIRIRRRAAPSGTATGLCIRPRCRASRDPNPRRRMRHRSRASTRIRCCARSGSRPERSTSFARAAPWHSSCDWRAAVLAHGPISSPPSTIIVRPVT